MPMAAFSVSEVRVAASCPRITYFDAEHARSHHFKTRPVTRIWKAGGNETACGSLFHHAVESFNRKAGAAPEVRAALEGDPDPRALDRRLREFFNTNCVDLDAVHKKPPAQQLGLVKALDVYMGELADIVGDARSRGKAAGEILDQLFGDNRRRVDVTFQVGPEGEPVRVTGVLDYVFHDWRTARQRIIDYKLTPAGEPSNDLFQVSLYALMHHAQHRTEPDVGVLYLHPERRMVEMTWEEVYARRHTLFDLLASMAQWVRYDEASGLGLKPPGVPTQCPSCKWDRDNACVQRLGPKHEGRRLRHWSDAAIGDRAGPEPRLEVREPTEAPGAWAEGVNPTADDATEPRPAPPTVTRPAGDVLRVGTTVEGGRPVGIPMAALPTHVAVVGAAGSGKTWMAKVIAEEAVRLGVPVLALDPQGDLVQFLRRSAEPPGLSAEDKAVRRAFFDRVEPRIWTPGSSHGRRLCLDPIRLAGRGELSRVGEPGRAEEEWEGMLAVTASQLVGLAKIGGETDSQTTFLLQVLRPLAGGDSGRDVDLATLADAVTNPGNVGLDDPDQLIKKSEREKLARKLNGLRLGPSAALYNGGQRLDLDAMCRPDAPGKTPLNVIYLNALVDDAQKQFFVASLAAEIYRWMITTLAADPGRASLLLYLDEASDYIPAGVVNPPAKTQYRSTGVAK